MLRNPIFGDFSGGVRTPCPPPSGSAYEKTISVNSSLAHCDSECKHVIQIFLISEIYLIQTIIAPQFYQMASNSQNALLKAPVGA